MDSAILTKPMTKDYLSGDKKEAIEAVQNPDCGLRTGAAGINKYEIATRGGGASDQNIFSGKAGAAEYDEPDSDAEFSGLCGRRG